MYFGAPLVAGLVNGLLLGDVGYGLSVGSTVMMAYIGMVAIGGSLPSDYALAGYLGVAMTMLAGADPLCWPYRGRAHWPAGSSQL